VLMYQCFPVLPRLIRAICFAYIFPLFKISVGSPFNFFTFARPWFCPKYSSVKYGPPFLVIAFLSGTANLLLKCSNVSFRLPCTHPTKQVERTTAQRPFQFLREPSFAAPFLSWVNLSFFLLRTSGSSLCPFFLSLIYFLKFRWLRDPSSHPASPLFLPFSVRSLAAANWA